MPNVFFHIALDQFGAECLGKFQAMASDITPPDVMHQFVWFNPAPQPSETNYWNSEHPKKWHFSCQESINRIVGDAYKDDYLSDDRSEMAGRIANAFGHGGELGAFFRWMVNEEAANLFGQGIPIRIQISLVGSVAHHWASAALLGFMQGWNFLQRIAALVNAAPDLRIILGTGYLTSSEGPPIESRRYQAAQALFDIEKFFKYQTKQLFAGMFEHPVHVVGDHPYSGNVAPDRNAQISIAAYGLCGIVHEIICEREPGDYLDILHFQRKDSGAVYGNNQEWNSARPFFAIGCYGIRSSRLAIKQALAIKFCVELFKVMAMQTDYGLLEKASIVTGIPKDKIAFFDSLERTVFEYTYSPFDPERTIQYNKNGEEPPKLFGITSLKQCFTSIFKNKEWERVIKNYGYNRIRALPLEDWVGAIEELEVVIEKGVLETRREELNLRSRQILIRFTEGIHNAIGEVFKKSFEPPVNSEPHQTAQLFLGRLDNRLQQEQDALEREGLIINPCRGDQKGEKTVGASYERAELLNALNDVPSPAAVGLRLIPLFAVAIGSAIGFPLDLGLLDPTHFRIIIGIIAGSVGAALLFHFQVRILRQKLYDMFNRWVNAYESSIDEFDKKLIKEVYYDLISHTREVLKWYFQGTTPEPNLPSPFGIYWKKQPVLSAINPTGGNKKILPPQKILSNFQEYLQKAANEYTAVFDFLRKSIKQSIVESAFPSSDELDHLYQSHFPESPDKSEAIKIADWAREKGDLFALFVPGKDGKQVASSWLYSHQMAPGLILSDREQRQKDAGFIFYKKVFNYLGSTLDNDLRLSHQLTKYLRKIKGATNLEGTPLVLDWRTYSRPPIAQKITTYDTAIGYAVNDYFANQNNVRNDVGKDLLHATIAISDPISAEDIVFYPNENNPKSNMGKAYKALSQGSAIVKSHEAVNPETLSVEESYK